MEGITKGNGIDFGAFRTRNIQRNGCRKLMIFRGDISKIMTEFLQNMPTGQKDCSNDNIGEFFKVYARLLRHLEAFFSILCKRRFHLNDLDVEKAMRYCYAIESLWRYLKISVTPKLHLFIVHLLRSMERGQGFGDLVEDSGEQSH